MLYTEVNTTPDFLCLTAGKAWKLLIFMADFAQTLVSVNKITSAVCSSRIWLMLSAFDPKPLVITCKKLHTLDRVEWWTCFTGFLPRLTILCSCLGFTVWLPSVFLCPLLSELARNAVLGLHGPLHVYVPNVTSSRDFPPHFFPLWRDFPCLVQARKTLVAAN